MGPAGNAPGFDVQRALQRERILRCALFALLSSPCSLRSPNQSATRAAHDTRCARHALLAGRGGTRSRPVQPARWSADPSRAAHARGCLQQSITAPAAMDAAPAPPRPPLPRMLGCWFASTAVERQFWASDHTRAILIERERWGVVSVLLLVLGGHVLGHPAKLLANKRVHRFISVAALSALSLRAYLGYLRPDTFWRYRCAAPPPAAAAAADAATAAAAAAAAAAIRGGGPAPAAGKPGAPHQPCSPPLPPPPTPRRSIIVASRLIRIGAAVMGNRLGDYG
jgi:hypothetical protein